MIRGFFLYFELLISLQVPMLERRTVWRDRSLSPVTRRNQYVAENTLGCYQNRSERRDNFTVDKITINM